MSEGSCDMFLTKSKYTCEIPNSSATFGKATVNFTNKTNQRLYELEVNVPCPIKYCKIQVISGWSGDDVLHSWTMKRPQEIFHFWHSEVNGHFRVHCEMKERKATEKLLDHDLELFNSKQWADVTFHVEDTEILAHRFVLVSRCPYFHTLFQSDLKEAQTGEIHVPDISPSGFKVILRFLYGGILLTESAKYLADVELWDEPGKDSMTEHTEFLAVEVLHKAHEYGLTELVEDCSDFMAISISVENVCQYFLVARLYGRNALTVQCVDFIRLYLDKVKKTDGWTRLCEYFKQ